MREEQEDAGSSMGRKRIHGSGEVSYGRGYSDTIIVKDEKCVGSSPVENYRQPDSVQTKPKSVNQNFPVSSQN